jgi:hypothetical protein
MVTTTRDKINSLVLFSALEFMKNLESYLRNWRILDYKRRVRAEAYQDMVKCYQISYVSNGKV